MKGAKSFELFPWVRTVDAFGSSETQQPNRAAREYTRGRQGVYVFRKRGVVRYVGSTVAGPDAAPLRMWKTILRHFQACAPVAAGRYGFGDDNWCARSRNDWRIVLYVLPASVDASTVRSLEEILIAKHKPADQAHKKPREAKKKRHARGSKARRT